ncbi:hypothetical protein EJ02DRAFT_457863 [Clathrospora elynae]|uniref:HD domain-containing protein n=1 Tax=Clathrospora elynae TaxID=706981 RepID=A0A6A5SIY1_9PLEO|nr:hypothetical protein EJ02DRAFT_457863 [Clathrospora elynae]
MNTLDVSNSHQHIRRVFSNAAYILEHEKKHHQWVRDIGAIVIWVACMTHDVGNAKYRFPSEKREQIDTIDEFLKDLDCLLPIRCPVAYLAANLSFTAEMQDRETITGIAEVTLRS